MSRVVVTVVVLAAAWAVVVTAAWVLQRHLIYLPYGAVPDPGRVGLTRAEAATLRTGDGLTLQAWYVPPARAEPVAGVIVFNGNAGNRAHRAPLAAALSDAGLAVLLVDYRGYGGNPGRPSQRGLSADARAAYAWMAARPDVGPDRLVYFGESLGAGPATVLAGEHPPRALVLRSPFTSLAAVGRIHYPFLPVGLLLRDRYPVADQVTGYDGPVLVVAGARDRIVPPGQSRAVAEAAGARYVEVPAAGHNDPALLAGHDLIGALLGFLAGDAALDVQTP